MTDKEKMEYAAKAADIKGDWSPMYEGIVVRTAPLRNFVLWNPRTSDQDSFHLMIKLRLNVFHVGNTVYTLESESDSMEEYCVDYGDDPIAATREAIFRVAVDIGTGMP